MSRQLYLDNEEITKYVQSLVQRVNEKILPRIWEKILLRMRFLLLGKLLKIAVRHAYPDAFLKNGSDMWWFGGTISSDASTITLICYDKGISIPRHIKEADIKEVEGIRR